jgi:hypothetical protein
MGLVRKEPTGLNLITHTESAMGIDAAGSSCLACMYDSWAYVLAVLLGMLIAWGISASRGLTRRLFAVASPSDTRETVSNATLAAPSRCPFGFSSNALPPSRETPEAAPTKRLPDETDAFTKGLSQKCPFLSPAPTTDRKVMVLTGASRGIGHGTVKLFAAAGWRVITLASTPWASDCPFSQGASDHVQVLLRLSAAAALACV